MREKDDFQNWLLLGLLTLIWGTSYILIKKALIVFNPIQVTAMRISLSFIVCLPFVPKAIREIPRAKYLHSAVVGLLGTGIPIILFNVSMTRVNSSVTAIINSLSPLFTVLTGFLFWQIRTTRIKFIGVLIGLVGAMTLVFGKHGFSLEGDVLYAILPIIATFCYGTTSNFVKKHFHSINSLNVTVLSLTAIGPFALVLLLYSDFGSRLSQPQAMLSLSSIVLLAIFGTVVGWFIFYRLIQRKDALFATSVTYLIPIVAIGWGIADGEGLAVFQLWGLALILTGVYFVSRLK